MKPPVMSPPPIKPQHQFIHTTMPISDTYPPFHPLFPSHFLLFGQTTAIQLHCCSRELCDTLSFIYIDFFLFNCFPPSSVFAERILLVTLIMTECLNGLRPLRAGRGGTNLGKAHDLLHAQYHHNRLPLSRNP